MIATIPVTSDITADTFATGTICYIADTTSNTVTITLESAAARDGQEYIIKHGAGANQLTVTPYGSETLDGQANWTSTTQYSVLHLFSDGSNWQKVDSSVGGTSAESLAESSYGTTVTLSSDGTDQTLTGSDGILNFIVDNKATPVMSLEYGTTFEGGAGIEIVNLYTYNGNIGIQLSGDNQILVNDDLPSWALLQCVTGAFTEGNSGNKLVARLSGAYTGLNSTNPAWLMRSHRLSAGVLEKAEIEVNSRTTRGGPEVELRATDNGTGSPTATFRIAQDPFSSGVGSLNALMYFDFQDSAGLQGTWGVTSNGEWFAGRNDSGDVTFPMISPAADGATAIGFSMKTESSLSTAGAKILTILNNATETTYIDKDGQLFSKQVGSSSDVGGAASTISLTNGNPALGGGAAATLGTIGGSGPTSAGQASWIKIYVGTTAHWVPVWT